MNFNIPENPTYTEEIRKFETTDEGHADLLNAVIEPLINNDAFIKKVAEAHIKNKNNPHETKFGDLEDKPTIPAAVRIKGSAETDYHTGDVEITPANIGLGNVANERQYSASNPQPSVTGSSGSCTGNSATATKATQDGNGNNIANTYAKKSIYGDTVVSCGRKSGYGIGSCSFAFGQDTVASGNLSHARGFDTKADGTCASAEGCETTASGPYSHSEGRGTTASGNDAHSEGLNTVASGYYSHAEGGTTKATTFACHSEGYRTNAENIASHASGKYNKAMVKNGSINYQIGDAFVIGNGTGDSNLSNALRVTYYGDILGTKAYQSSGADYAEFVKPWADRNLEGEDRIGYFVTVKDGFLHKANEGDYIFGITSGNPSVIGNADEDYYWKYVRDEFNRIVMEDVPEMAQQRDEDGNLVFDKETHEPIMVETGNVVKNARMKLADGYDPSLQESYIPRAERREWDYVGMRGIIPVRDDGTCLQDRFCKCGRDGIATLAEERGFDTFYVIERISENIVSVEI